MHRRRLLGFQYGFTRKSPTTTIPWWKEGVQLLVDPMGYQYLVSAEIDYQESLQGSQFVIKNPNASSTCGCGSSFSV